MLFSGDRLTIEYTEKQSLVDLELDFSKLHDKNKVVVAVLTKRSPHSDLFTARLLEVFIEFIRQLQRAQQKQWIDQKISTKLTNLRVLTFF